MFYPMIENYLRVSSQNYFISKKYSSYWPKKNSTQCVGMTLLLADVTDDFTFFYDGDFRFE